MDNLDDYIIMEEENDDEDNEISGKNWRKSIWNRNSIV